MVGNEADKIDTAWTLDPAEEQHGTKFGWTLSAMLHFALLCFCLIASTIASLEHRLDPSLIKPVTISLSEYEAILAESRSRAYYKYSPNSAGGGSLPSAPKLNGQSPATKAANASLGAGSLGAKNSSSSSAKARQVVAKQEETLSVSSALPLIVKNAVEAAAKEPQLCREELKIVQSISKGEDAIAAYKDNNAAPVPVNEEKKADEVQPAAQSQVQTQAQDAAAQPPLDDATSPAEEVVDSSSAVAQTNVAEDAAAAPKDDAAAVPPAATTPATDSAVQSAPASSVTSLGDNSGGVISDDAGPSSDGGSQDVLEEDFAVSLSNLFSDEPTKRTKLNELSVEGKVLKRIIKCWQNYQQYDPQEFHGSISIVAEFQRDGSLTSVLQAEDPEAFGKQEARFRKALSRDAIKALGRCTPLKDMPVDEYDQWKTVRFKFHY